MTIAHLSGLALPGEFARHSVIPEALRNRDFECEYDYQTLVYDAFYVASKRAICLICPALLNFEAVLRQGTFAADGKRVRIGKIAQYKRFAEIWLPCAAPPSILRFEHARFAADIPVAHGETAAFAGLNCAVVKSKNNDLRWIEDWARYHVKVHELQGLVFFDNNSDRYDLDAVEASLGSVGLKAFRVIPAPYKFGVRRHSDTMFLQLGLMNIARLRFLSGAAAVLCTDIDELVSPTPEGSVFRFTQRSWLGYVLFEGRWRYASPRQTESIAHSDHVFRTSEDPALPTKYCICPTGPVGFSHWDIHGAVRGSLKKWMITRRLEYWHCKQISTHWRHERKVPAELVLSKRTARVLGEVFGRPVTGAEQT